MNVCSDINLIPEEVACKLALTYNRTDAFGFRTPTGEQVPIRYYAYAYVIPKVVITTFPLLLGLNWMKEY